LEIIIARRALMTKRTGVQLVHVGDSRRHFARHDAHEDPRVARRGAIAGHGDAETRRRAWVEVRSPLDRATPRARRFIPAFAPPALGTSPTLTHPRLPPVSPSRTESWRPWVTAPPTDVHRVESWNRAGIATSAAAREAAEAGVEDLDAKKSDGITLTDACVRRLRELAAEDPAASILRVAVDGGGCSGYQYTFSLDTEPAPRDRVFDVGGARVAVDEISFEFVKGATVDYVEEMIRSSFAIADNPNAESGCGCGSSFVAK